MIRPHCVALIALLSLVLPGCGEREGLEDPPEQKNPRPVDLVLRDDGTPDPAVLAANPILRRGNGEEPQTLDPHRAEGVPAAHILRDLFEGLTTEAPDGTVVPGAAARWNISRDARTYTFYLRRDATWSNGDPLTADDFIFSLRRSADPRTASNSAAMLLPILNAREVISGEQPVEAMGVTRLDDYSLQITLVAPTPYFLGLLMHPVAYPVHRPSLEQHGDRFARADNLVSNGAYRLKRWEVRSSIELEKNPLYHDAENVLITAVTYLPIEDLSSEVKQFRAGELHWTYEVPNNQFQWLQRHYPEALTVSPWLGSYFYGFNLLRAPFADNPRLRRALVLAIDREVLTSRVTQFGELPSFNLVPPGIGDYQPPLPEYAGWTQPERNAEARRLYQQAGYTAEHPLRVEVRYNTSENHKKIALAIASMWKQELGVIATLVNEEWKVFLQNREQKAITQVFRAGWISDYNDPYSFLEQFRTDSGRNDYAWSNSSFDALLDEIARERIPARRDRLMVEAERILLEDNPIIPVYTYVTKRLVDPHLKGWQDNVMDHHLTRHMFLLRSRDAAAPAAEADEAPEAVAEAPEAAEAPGAAAEAPGAAEVGSAAGARSPAGAATATGRAATGPGPESAEPGA